jgi:hypothetical protein
LNPIDRLDDGLFVAGMSREFLTESDVLSAMRSDDREPVLPQPCGI